MLEIISSDESRPKKIASQRLEELRIAFEDVDKTNVKKDSRRFKSEEIPEAEIFYDGCYICSPSYMSPEQAEFNLGEIDESSDVFSLGCILYSLLTLEQPYTGRDKAEVILKAARCDFVHPSEIDSDRKIPKELEAIVLKAMKKKKKHRYKSVNEFRADIENFIQNRALDAFESTTQEKLVRWTARNPMKAFAIGILVFFLLVFSILALIGYTQYLSIELKSKTETIKKLKEEKKSEKKKNTKIIKTANWIDNSKTDK